MTPKQIIETAIARGIAVIAITDHNSIANVERALSVAEGHKDKIVVLPGIEITTAHGHVLAAYAPDRTKELQALVVRLDFQEDDQGAMHTRLPIEKVAELVAADGGLCIPTHIDREGTGFERKATYRDREAVIHSPDVVALEVDDIAHATWYEQHDTSDGHGERAQLLLGRETKLGKPQGSRLPKVRFSDAHQLPDIGRDRKTQAEKLTRVKMDTPSFEALRVAFHDPEARIRLEAELPPFYPRLLGVRFIDGFLDSQEVSFSPNLTCLIGGRGTGKSTALDAVRWSCSATASSDMIGKENWPQQVELCYEDEHGQRHWVTREAGRSAPYERVNGEQVEVNFSLEGYEQDRTGSIIRAYEKDPRQLLTFLDQFIDLAVIVSDLEETRFGLSENAKAVKPIEDTPKQLADARTASSQIKAKVDAVNKSNVKEALDWRRRLLAEQRLRTNVLNRIEEIATAIDALPVSVDLAQLGVDVGISDLSKTISRKILVGASTPTVAALVDTFEHELAKWKLSGAKSVDDLRDRLKPLVEQWEEADRTIEARIKAVTDALVAKGIQPDLKSLNQLATDEDKIKARIRELDAIHERLKTLLRERKTLLVTYGRLQERRFHHRQARATSLSEKLKRSIERFQIDVTFKQGSIVGEYDAWVRSALERRFVRGDRLPRLCRAVQPAALAKMAGDDNWRAAAQLADETDAKFLDNDQQAKDFLAHLRSCDLFALEEIQVDDRPLISLTIESGGKIHTAPFQDLSFGQKSAILLSVLLFSDANHPLIVDQPEDHLDSQFIYDVVVQTLRRVKETRQVIVATHNANIAVLGDAELLVPLKSWRNKGQIKDRGSVDAVQTAKLACAILEGGEVAYRRRGEMYGIPSRA
jgi:DNA repair ATPase RecN